MPDMPCFLANQIMLYFLLWDLIGAICAQCSTKLVKRQLVQCTTLPFHEICMRSLLKTGAHMPKLDRSRFLTCQVKWNEGGALSNTLSVFFEKTSLNHMAFFHGKNVQKHNPIYHFLWKKYLAMFQNEPNLTGILFIRSEQQSLNLPFSSLKWACLFTFSLQNWRTRNQTWLLSFS